MLNHLELQQTFTAKKKLSDLVPGAPREALDLIQKLLTYDPSKRLTAMQVLQHEFLKDMYSPGDMFIKEGKPVPYFEFQYETFQLSVDLIRDLVIDEILISNSQEARTTYDKLVETYPEGLMSKKYLVMNDDTASSRDAKKSREESKQLTTPKTNKPGLLNLAYTYEKA